MLQGRFHGENRPAKWLYSWGSPTPSPAATRYLLIAQAQGCAGAQEDSAWIASVFVPR